MFSLVFALVNILVLFNKANAEIVSISINEIESEVFIAEDIEGDRDHLITSQNSTKAYPPPRVTVPNNKIILDL